MPGFNRRGPENEGAKTGRGMGRCNPANHGKTDEEIVRGNKFQTLSDNSAGIGRRLGGRKLHRGYGQGNA